MPAHDERRPIQAPEPCALLFAVRDRLLLGLVRADRGLKTQYITLLVSISLDEFVDRGSTPSARLRDITVLSTLTRVLTQLAIVTSEASCAFASAADRP